MFFGISYVDVLVVAVVALCASLGLLTGFVWQVAGIVSLAAGMAAALLFGGMVSDALSQWIESRPVANIIAYTSVFSLTAMAVRVVAVVFSKILEKFRLQKFDKLVGAAAGAVKGIIICAVVVTILARSGSVGARDAVNNSLLGYSVVGTTDWIFGKIKQLPGKVKNVINSGE